MKRGFTLVELLITMGVIAILATAVLFAMVTAQTAAREHKTQTMIAKIDQLLMERYDSYRTRRVPIDTSSAGTDREAAAKMRLNAIRRLMQLEMPERWSEVNSPAITPLTQRPTLSLAYQRRYDTGPPTTQNQGAETLYLVVTLACGDGEALEHFKASDIKDTDGDGAPEFVDGWGNPISWLRWPAGFVSERQSQNAIEDHDPFDPFNVHPAAYRLVPLVYSSGSDSDFGVAFGNPLGDSDPGPFSYPANTVDSLISPDPFATQASGVQIGTPTDPDGVGADNIHNHLLGTR